MAEVLAVSRKEVADIFGSKRYLILFALILLLSTLSAYQGAEYIRNNPEAGFLAIFSGAGFGFSFLQWMIFFGPLLGLALGFDAINKEKTSGTLSILLSQPIFRDSVINGKFIAGAAALATLTVSTIGIMCGLAIPMIGFGPTFEGASRVVLLSSLTVLYLAFWLSLGLLFSVLTKKTSTSMLSSVATWLFFTIVINILAYLIASLMVPVPSGMFRTGDLEGQGLDIFQSPEYLELMQRRIAVTSTILKVSPINLYSEAALAILGVVQVLPGMDAPSVASGLAAIWANIAAIAVGLVVCFAASYVKFLRSEIRPGG
ncbi:MAG: ABC transporter permease [Aigarchaeota archaeon]|nr:ABC transporter permease [Aigarchaeota archaeon]